MLTQIVLKLAMLMDGPAVDTEPHQVVETNRFM